MLQSFHIQSDAQKRFFLVDIESPHFYFISPNQVISPQVITGEQGEKYCETLPAPFERHDSEFSGGVPIEKTNTDSLNLPCHIKSTYYESLSVT